MAKKTGVILCALILVSLLWAVAGHTSDEDRVGPNAWLLAHVGNEMLITLQVSLIDEIGKVLIVKLLDVEEDGIVVMFIGDIHSDRDGKPEVGDLIKLWTKKKLSVFLTYSSIVTIQTFQDAKEELWKHLRWRQIKKDQAREKKEQARKK